MSNKREEYDNAHKKTMDEINSTNEESIAEQFVKSVVNFPANAIDYLTTQTSDNENKAERDAHDGKYDPPDED